ncbi:MAG: hypothetical protein ACRDNL_23645 [Spirillospora sp.]
MRRTPRTLLALVALLIVAGCGIRPTGIIDAGEPPSANGAAADITVYLARGGKLWPVRRPGVPGQPYLAIEQLAVRPTEQERAAGLHTEVGHALHAYTVTAASELLDTRSTLVVGANAVKARPSPWSPIAVAQIACTAQALPGVEQVKLWGAPKSDDYGWGKVSCDQFADMLVSRG